MIHTTVVTGVFTQDDLPVQGVVRFTPSRMWVIQLRTAWACLAPLVRLAPDGSFTAEVTATDSDAVMWHYLVATPAGCFRVEVPWNEVGWSLRDLIDEHHVGPWAPDRR